MIESGRDRSRRIDTNYHRQVDWVVMQKRYAGLVSLALGLVLSTWFVFASVTSRDSTLMSTGDLSSSHAQLVGAHCGQCHSPNIPIRTDAVWGKDPHHIKVNNQNCDKCHASAGHFVQHTKNHIHQLTSCNDCHREHLGADNRLIRKDDLQCIRCHKNLAEFAEIAERRQDAHNFSIPNGHPEFRSLASDPGTIHFNHAQHMLPGQVVLASDKSAMTFDRMPAAFRSRYRAKADGLVQLNCSDCHVPDSAWPNQPTLDNKSDNSNGLSGSVASAQSSHRFFQPVKFDDHCAACHQLQERVQHGLNREETLTQIARAAADFVLKQPSKSDLKSASSARAQQVAAIFNNGQMCSMCHQLAQPNAEHIVLPSRIPQRWLQGARFDHGSHAQVACQTCHEHAFPGSPAASADVEPSKQVMIAGWKVCAKCHISDSTQLKSLSTEELKRTTDGACITCHGFHVDLPTHPEAMRQ